MAAKDWTQPLQVPLNDGYSLTLRFLWVAQTIEEENTFKAVVKIQAMFRGMRARKNLAVLKKTVRNVISRRAFSSDKRYFVLSVIEEDDNLLLELHLADDPDHPMYEVVSSCKCDKIPLEDIFENITVSDDYQISVRNS